MKSDFVRTFSSELDNFVKPFKCLSNPFGITDCCTCVDFGNRRTAYSFYFVNQKKNKKPSNEILNLLSNLSTLFVPCPV